METCQGLEFIRSYHPHRWYKDGTEMDVGGILVNTGQPINPTNHHSYAIPADTILTHGAHPFKPK